MSAQERKSFGNGVWLCQPCSTKIDQDEERYPPSLLRSWKTEAERLADDEIGRRLPSKQDAFDNVVAMMGSMPKRFSEDGIANVHQAYAARLESVDPRFSITTSYGDKATCIEVRAKEDVSFTLKVQPDRAAEYAEKLRLLFERGEDLRIDADAIRLEGSELFEELRLPGKGMFEMKSTKQVAKTKLWLCSPDGGLRDPFEEAVGEISAGTAYVAFDGKSCGGILSIHYGHALSGKEPPALELKFDSTLWNGRNILTLSYYSQLKLLLDRLEKGWSLDIALEVEGNRISVSKGAGLGGSDFVRTLVFLISFIDAVRAIAERVAQTIMFRGTRTISINEYRTAKQLSQVMAGDEVTFEAIASNPKFEMEVSDVQIVRQYLESQTPHSAKIISRERAVQLFGYCFAVPLLSRFIGRQSWDPSSLIVTS
ncbi:hypothetical protein [Nevskia soli]|uniref:hypothetical protein n=1 Tax=Nevskia soli TaxID=418856 RepID=UPI0012F80FFA|nr:hypothetical protein [Nevskia soli]